MGSFSLTAQAPSNGGNGWAGEELSSGFNNIVPFEDDFDAEQKSGAQNNYMDREGTRKDRSSCNDASSNHINETLDRIHKRILTERNRARSRVERLRSSPLRSSDQHGSFLPESTKIFREKYSSKIISVVTVEKRRDDGKKDFDGLCENEGHDGNVLDQIRGRIQCERNRALCRVERLQNSPYRRRNSMPSGESKNDDLNRRMLTSPMPHLNLEELKTTTQDLKLVHDVDHDDAERSTSDIRIEGEVKIPGYENAREAPDQSDREVEFDLDLDEILGSAGGRQPRGKAVHTSKDGNISGENSEADCEDCDSDASVANSESEYDDDDKELDYLLGTVHEERYEDSRDEEDKDPAFGKDKEDTSNYQSTREEAAKGKLDHVIDKKTRGDIGSCEVASASSMGDESTTGTMRTSSSSISEDYVLKQASFEKRIQALEAELEAKTNECNQLRQDLAQTEQRLYQEQQQSIQKLNSIHKRLREASDGPPSMPSLSWFRAAPIVDLIAPAIINSSLFNSSLFKLVGSSDADHGLVLFQTGHDTDGDHSTNDSSFETATKSSYFHSWPSLNAVKVSLWDSHFKPANIMLRDTLSHKGIQDVSCWSFGSKSHDGECCLWGKNDFWTKVRGPSFLSPVMRVIGKFRSRFENVATGTDSSA